MSGNESYRERLAELSDTFSQTALECVDIYFSVKSTLPLPWEVVDHLQSKFDLILTIGSSNDKNSALMYAGIQQESLAAFTGKDDVTTEEASDILGEFVNVYSGMISDKRAFTEKFGILSQAVPILCIDGQSYLPVIWGIQGYVYVQRHWIYIGYTIRENISSKNV